MEWRNILLPSTANYAQVYTAAATATAACVEYIQEQELGAVEPTDGAPCTRADKTKIVLDDMITSKRITEFDRDEDSGSSHVSGCIQEALRAVIVHHFPDQCSFVCVRLVISLNPLSAMVYDSRLCFNIINFILLLRWLAGWLVG